MKGAVPPCRVCGASTVEPVLDLGQVPLANDLRDPKAAQDGWDTFPLEVVFCPSCSLVQITEDVPADRLFRDYVYFSSYSDTMVDHARRLADRHVEARDLGAANFVVEVASNDGYLLQHYKARGVPVLGVDPAENVAEVARTKRGVPTWTEFFDLEVAYRILDEHGAADVVHLHNVLAHVPDPHEIVAGLGRLLSPEGVAVVEVPYVRDLVESTEFDTIYHEHRCYFSATALDHLFKAANLTIQDVRRIPIHGGSLQLEVGHGSHQTKRAEQVLAEERTMGLTEHGYYQGFSEKVATLRSDLCELVDALQASGARIAAYGASAKGAILLNYTGLADAIAFVVDRNPTKQGKVMPGTEVPIHAPSALLEDQPDAVLLLAWNYAEEIMEQQREYRRAGGRFIVPVPEPKVV